MNLHPLIARFEKVAESPSNIARLRKLIIHLAISGTLVINDFSEQFVRETVLLIEKERLRRLKGGKDKKKTTLTQVAEDDLPVRGANPSRFVRLDDIALIVKGPTAIQGAEPGEYPLITTAEKKSSCDHFDFDGRAAIVPLVSSTGHGSATLNRLHYYEGKFALGSILCAVFPFREEIFSARFILEYLSAFKNELLISRMTGTANVTLTLGRIGEVPIPIVSLRVQERVDELMRLCDELEIAVCEQEKLRERLTSAVHHHLNNAGNSESLRHYAWFFKNHLPRLSSQQIHIKQLRQTALNLAVRGLLVRQDLADESATSLLNRDDDARQMIAKSDRRADPQRQHLLAQELRWVTPASWEWSALADIALFIDYRGKTPIKTEKGVRLITAKNVKKGVIDKYPEEWLSEADFQLWMTRGFPAKGDVLFTTEAPMGNAAVVSKTERFALAQRVICLRPYGAVDSDFLAVQILSDQFQAILNAQATGLTAKGIKAAKLKRIPVAIPPLAEQRRIVAKVATLMELFSSLEVGLELVQVGSGRLLESVLHHSLNPETQSSVSNGVLEGAV